MRCVDNENRLCEDLGDIVQATAAATSTCTVIGRITLVPTYSRASCLLFSNERANLTTILHCLLYCITVNNYKDEELVHRLNSFGSARDSFFESDCNRARAASSNCNRADSFFFAAAPSRRFGPASPPGRTSSPSLAPGGAAGLCKAALWALK